MSPVEVLELMAGGLKCGRCGSDADLYVVTHCKDGVKPTPVSIDELQKFDKKDLRIHCWGCCIFDNLDVMAAYYGSGTPSHVMVSQGQYRAYKNLLCDKQRYEK